MNAAQGPRPVMACSASLFSRREASIGVRVNDTSSENSVAATIVRPNSRNSWPMLPDMNATGAYTTTSVSVMAMAASPISERPSSAAFQGLLPMARWRLMFSSTTI